MPDRKENTEPTPADENIHCPGIGCQEVGPAAADCPSKAQRVRGEKERRVCRRRTFKIMNNQILQ